MYRVISGCRIRPFSRCGNFISSRSVSYVLPTIPLLENLRVSQKDFDGLYSSNTVNELWFKRCSALVDRLNQLLEENQVTSPADLEELITITFNKHELSEIYTHASLIHNLQFHFESLRPSNIPGHPMKHYDANDLLRTPSIEESFPNEPRDDSLREWIAHSFGSLPEFRTLLLNSAKGIKGDGTVWLVAQSTYSESAVRNNLGYLINNASDLKYSSLSIINTYNAGIVDDSIRSRQLSKLKQQEQARISLLKKRAEERREIESNTDHEEVIERSNDPEEASAKNNLSLGTLEDAEEAVLFSERKLLPLLSIDVSPRTYLLDYGVFGKQRYLENIWNCIDWDVVSKRAPPRFKQSFEMD